MVHGELAEVDGAAAQTKKVVPLFQVGFVVAGVAVDHFNIRRDDPHGGKLTADVRRGQQLLRVEEDVVVHDLNARDVARVNEIGQFDMKAAEEAFQWHLQHAELRDMKLHAAVRDRGEGAGQLNRKRNDLVDGAMQLELVAVRLD